MATFEPGHLHIERHAFNKDDVSYNVRIDYEVIKDPKEGKGMQFKMHGSIGSMHKHYDLMFEDVRVQLNMQSGDPVKPEHLE